MNDVTPSNTGVVDPSILDTSLSAEEQSYVSADPEADLPSDEQAQAVIDALPEEVTAEGEYEAALDSGRTLQEQELLADEGQTEPVVTPEEHAIPSSSNRGSNQPASPEEMRKDLFKDVNRFGKASGEGASALGRLGIRVLRAAADGVLTTAKPQGGGKDDATLVYETYAAMDSKHAEHTAGGAKANASKLRQIIGMGCMTTLSDPVAVGDRAVRIREEMEGADLKPKALFAALVDVAREQQASDTELSDAAIKECCTKTKADKTLEKEWAAIAKRIDGIVTGEASHGLKDQSDAALKIAQMVDEHIKNYALDGKRQELIESLMENGYTRAMATSIVDKKLEA